MINGVLVVLSEYNYMYYVFLFYTLLIVLGIISNIFDHRESYSFLVILFIAIPGYTLFFLKVLIVLGLITKLILFLSIFEVVLLFYYFRVFLGFYFVRGELLLFLNFIAMIFTMISGGNQ